MFQGRRDPKSLLDGTSKTQWVSEKKRRDVESPALLIIMMWLDVTPLGGEEARSKHGATEKWRKHHRQISLLLLEQYVSQETTLFGKQLNLPGRSLGEQGRGLSQS